MRDRIGPYRIERVLSNVGMSAVYLGRHDSLDRLAAIKTLFPNDVADPVLRERLKREARAQSRLTHPNIVVVYDFIEERGELFLPMEYVEGGTLEQLLERQPGSRMAIEEALPFFEEVLTALAYVHDQKIIHRDVKPSNVMVSGRHAKVADFGIALLTDEPRLTRSERIIGSLPYMSPEQVQGHPLDHRTDIYSAALVLYRMLAGHPPFESKGYLAQVHERLEGPPDLRNLVPDLSAGIHEAMAIALQVDPNGRFESAGAFRSALHDAALGFLPSIHAVMEEVVGSSDNPTEPIIQVTPADRPRAFAALAWLIVAGTLLAGTYGALQLGREPLRQPGPPPPVKSGVLSWLPTFDPNVLQAPQKPPAVEPPKSEPPLAVAKATPDPAAEEEKRHREIDGLRDEIHRGLLSVEAAVRTELFDPANEELDRIALKTQLHPDDFREERHEVARLRALIVQAQADLRTRKEREDRFASRLARIEEDLHRERWPEVERFAQDIVDDEQAPVAIAARARELLRQAKEGRKAGFLGTEVSSTNNTIRKPSSPPRKHP